MSDYDEEFDEGPDDDAMSLEEDERGFGLFDDEGSADDDDLDPDED